MFIILILHTFTLIILYVFIYTKSAHKVEPIVNLDGLFSRYEHLLFSISEYDYGRCLSKFTHNINSSSSCIFTAPESRTSIATLIGDQQILPNETLVLVKEQVNELLKRRIITQVDSNLLHKYKPLSVNFNVKKSSFAVDLASLNKSTRLEVCQSTVSSEELKALIDSKVFSVLDFRGGMYQVSLDEDSKNRTVFKLPGIGLFRFEVVPPGLLNTTITFQKLLLVILAACIAKKFCLIYCGKIVVYSESFEEHLGHLTHVFEIVVKQRIKLKREDCLFMQTQVRLFNNLIGGGQLVHNEATLALVHNISRPQKSQPSKRFVSLCQAYKDSLGSLCNFADLMRRLSVAIDGGADSGAFEALKQGLLKTLDKDLSRINPGVELFLVVNLSRACFSCSLFEQRNKKEPIAFNRKLLLERRESVDFGNVRVSNEEKMACIEWAIANYEAVLSRRRFLVALFHRKRCETELRELVRNRTWNEKMAEFDFEFVGDGQEEQNRVNEILTGMF